MSSDTARIRILVDDHRVLRQGSAGLVAVRSYLMALKGLGSVRPLLPAGNAFAPGSAQLLLQASTHAMH